MVHSGGAVALGVLHPEGVALKLDGLIEAQAAPEGIPVIQEDIALPVAGLTGHRLVPIRILHTTQPHSVSCLILNLFCLQRSSCSTRLSCVQQAIL